MPIWTPPDSVVGPVWTTLYLLMAVSAWLAWRRDGWLSARAPLGWFGLQLALNVGWSALFFGIRRSGVALVVIIVLWLAIAATAIAFGGRSTAAALMLTPYIAWTSFAALLNLFIWSMNS